MINPEAVIYSGRTIVAEFARAEDAVSCLKFMSHALDCDLRLETRKRTQCRIPDKVALYGNEMFYRRMTP